MIVEKIKDLIDQMELKKMGDNGFVPKIENIVMELAKLVDEEINKLRGVK